MAVRISKANFFVDYKTSKEILKIFFSKRFVASISDENMMQEIFNHIEKEALMNVLSGEDEN